MTSDPVPVSRPALADLRLPPVARAGDPLAAIDTPALVLDLDAFERNVAAMQAQATRAGVALRPHAKAHKCPQVALAQLRAGAVGICCQKVSEALPFLHAGVDDILISNQIAGPAKADLLAHMARHGRLAVCVDHPAQVQWLAAATAACESRLDVLVELNIGQDRCGVPDADGVLRLLDALTGHRQLAFRGLQAYHGGIQHLRGHAERREAAARSAARTAAVVDALAHAGVACPTVTGGGTGSVEFDLASGVYTEVQPGSYVFMDADYGRNERGEGWRFEQSLFVATAVMSLGGDGRVVLDAGLKSMSAESGLPLVWSASGESGAFRSVAVNDEHGIVRQLHADASPPAHGTLMRLAPGHCDPTVNLHDDLVVLRRGQVEAIWPIAARGLSR